MNEMSDRKTTKNRPPLDKGWDAENETYDRVYAVKIGKKIFSNTGIYMHPGRITIAQKPYVQESVKTKVQFDKEVAKHKAMGVEYIIHDESDHPIRIKRLMVRVV